MNKPELLATIRTDEIEEAAQEMLDFYESDDFDEDRIGDYEGELIDVVMKALYGNQVWDWINDQHE